MKYLLTIVVALGLVGYAFVKGYSVRDHEDDRLAYPCAPDSILSATNPDARYSHCHDMDWDGSTLLRDRLAEAQERPDVYAIIFESNEVHSLAIPFGMTTETQADPDPHPPISKTSPTHTADLCTADP